MTAMQAQATRTGARFIQHEAVICAQMAGERAAVPAARTSTQLPTCSLRESARVPDGFWRWVETLPQAPTRRAIWVTVAYDGAANNWNRIAEGAA